MQNDIGCLKCPFKGDPAEQLILIKFLTLRNDVVDWALCLCPLRVETITGILLPTGPGPGFSLNTRSPINSAWNVAVVLE